MQSLKRLAACCPGYEPAMYGAQLSRQDVAAALQHAINDLNRHLTWRHSAPLGLVLRRMPDPLLPPGAASMAQQLERYPNVVPECVSRKTVYTTAVQMFGAEQVNGLLLQHGALLPTSSVWLAMEATSRDLEKHMPDGGCGSGGFDAMPPVGSRLRCTVCWGRAKEGGGGRPMHTHLLCLKTQVPNHPDDTLPFRVCTPLGAQMRHAACWSLVTLCLVAGP